MVSFRPPPGPALPMTTCTRLAAALLAVLSLAACDGVLEPGERAQEKLVFLRYADATRKNSPYDSLDIYRMNADGTGLQNLTNHLAQYSNVSASPDGRKLMFTSSRGDGQSRIWTMNSDGTGLKQITNGNSAQPRWSPDGNRIAFGMLGADGYHVYVMNADGSNATRVSGPAMQVGSSCPNSTSTRIDLVGWIPDGRIAFTRGYCGYGYRYFLVNADGSGFTETQIKLYDAHWSPDGSRVVYLSPAETYWRVMVANADGSGARVLSTQGTHQGLPWSNSWSPDSKRIVFFADTREDAASERGCTESVLPYVVNVDGSGVQRLLDSCRGYFNGWSRSGEQVAFTLFPGSGEFPTSVPDIHVVNADGSGSVNLTNSPHWESDPIWVRR